ncbi:MULTISPECIES: peptidoglycan-binding domain-containing protein [Shimia]|uniref:peptidoglycan-binding domain-containing protein n=1 Tax=Shimia TaxID=573139 RepID=UPI001FB421D8|nr:MULTISPECIES: peptidoglycan-binding domain-containing protein [Shimia]MDV4146075.1 peptidoglycan-binding domain-containing protein [Shimia sp. FJ5]
MFSRSLKTGLIAAFMATSSTAAMADNLGAAIVGGIIGGALMNEHNKSKKRSSTTSSRYSATRAHNRETQASLNYFGFNAGTPDGVMGSRSRAAITQYQIYVGFPATGRLTQYERDFLVSSYNRAQVGGPQVIKAMQGPDGTRSLLKTWYGEATGGRMAGNTYNGMPVDVSAAVDEVAASSDPSAEQLLQRSGFIQLADLNGDGKTDYILDTSKSGSSFWCGAQSCTVMVFASTPQGYARNDFLSHDATPALFSCHQGVCRMGGAASQPQMAAAPAPQPTPQPVPQQGGTVMASGQATQAAPLGGITLFNTGPAETAGPSLASLCSKVSLLTNSNGGFTTVSNISDPEFALNEQFCLARTYAIGAGETLVDGLQGVTPAQVDAQCDAFGPALEPFLAKLSTTPAAGVVSEAQNFVLKSNMSIEQLSGTAKICLFSGYRRDAMPVALGSALLMVAMGQKPYAELIGHHLAQGFGVGASQDRAQDWYMMAIEAMEGGAEPVFAPGQPERVQLLRAAVTAGETPMASPQPAAALPSFNLGD